MSKQTGLLLFLILLLCLIPCKAQATDYTQDANCQGAWLMDVDESPLQDASSSNRDLSLKGAGEPDYTASGKFGGGYSFDGTDDYLVSPGWNPPTGAFTQTIWINPDDNTLRAIATFQDSLTGGTNDRAFWIDASSKAVYYVYNGAEKKATSTTSIPLSEWTFLAGTINTTSGNSIWVNGVNENTNAGGTNGFTHSVAEYYIGAEVNTYADYEFDGLMDEGAVFSRTLDSTEINDIMDNGLVGGAPATYKGWYTVITQ